ncbi:MAG: hypothetical protein IT269_09535 [Saprospiraceae bacterium]|nr:hypothetical protein [Saprospiraceae bacterium]
MKHLYFFCFLTVCLLFSCTKEEPVTNEPPVTEPPILTDPPIIELGKSSFLMNNTSWAGQVKAEFLGSVNGKKTIRLIGYRGFPNNTISEYFVVTDLLPERGRFKFNCYCDSSANVYNGTPKVSMIWFIGGDQLLGADRIDTTYASSYIEVLKYDSVQQTIEGRFEAHLKDREATGPNPYYPTEVHLTEGKFNLKIEQ